VPTHVTLELATPAQHPLIERLWQLYRHDLSEFRDSMPDQDGLFRRGWLDDYLGDPARECLVIRVPEGPAGFVLLKGLGEGEVRAIGEFFVVRRVRGRGVGREAALQALDRHPGTWEIAFQEENPTAARFWRRIATEVAGDTWTEERRPVPDKPWIPPDVWLSLTV
jgi:predicted acetyltransferase